ncbi:hypothetical protein GC197_11490 [bacterium]|nr:hypothetical protein [bacterium]
MDDGGLRIQESIVWLDEGIRRIHAVESGELESSDWDRETWGVALGNNAARIYSLHDEGYFQIVSLKGFLKVLETWRAFVQSNPSDQETLEFSIDE